MEVHTVQVPLAGRNRPYDVIVSDTEGMFDGPHV
jgi:hypothetical protein